MTDTATTDVTPQPKRLGLLAQFAGPDELIAAAEKVTDAGYQKVEAYSPFAVIGIDEALKAKKTQLPWLVFCMGLTGCLVGITMQCYMNGVEGSWWLSGYDYLISGKPSFSIPAFIPVTFELTILLSAFGAFFGMLAFNQLPKLFNPLLRSDRFAEVTTDGFFLLVDAKDGKYAEAETEAFLTSVGATAVETVDEVVTGYALPAGIHLVGASVATAALLVPLYLWMTSSTTTSLPRITLFKDMENQAKYKAQRPSTLFADGRAARPPIDGTVARGSGKDDVELYYGVKPESNLVGAFGGGDLQFASFNGDGPVKATLVAEGDEADSAAEPAEAAADAAPAEMEEKDWVTEFPKSLKISSQLMDRGQQRFNIHCAACHGLTGAGDGLVTQRALGLQQGTWVQPTSLHAEAVVTQPVGRIFNTITNGIRKMPGYKEHITPEDRWAIVLYLQALQRSQNASADDLPADKRRELSTLK
ncbi:Cytochrome c [Botrimarina colliarenosi]|uniref:Cytochrome c n=1 Tax=Botrimarina colliarenosi TaxID=2528001 RepID=A0A5C6AIM4_9BACT|nr:quinol:electron acceptor oxidoreductase subunit ActD [Botrimarina colliarenosi]TWT99864.1 Cytochrome c [Botrimarina colliarenosi]